MILFSTRRPTLARRLAFTLTELLIATSIGLLVGGGGILLVIETARENLRSVADMTVEQAATELEGRVTAILRSMSEREGIAFRWPTTDAQDGYHGYQAIVVAQGPAPDFPRAELRFESTNGRAIFLPNRAQAGTQQLLMQNHTNRIILRNLCFFPAIKPDTTPDNSIVNVVVEMDDDGLGRRATNANPARVQRTFAVKMRNQ